MSAASLDRFAPIQSTLPGTQVSGAIAPGSREILAALEYGEAELGFAQADAVYTAFHTGFGDQRGPYANLRAVGVMESAVIYVTVRADSPYLHLDQLTGTSIGIDPPGSYGELYARMILRHHSVDDREARFRRCTPDQMASGLEDRSLDAAVFVGGARQLALLHQINARTPLRVIGFDRSAIITLRSQFPFFKSIFLAPGDLGDGVQTLGVDSLLISRADLDEDLVYQLTRTFFAEAERLAYAAEGSLPVDLEEAPATPIPLHPGAARYYREREVQR